MNYNYLTFKKFAADKNYESIISEVKYLYEKTHSDDIKTLKYSEFKLFFETGSRIEYERSYFERRGRLLASSILCMLYDDEKYLTDLCDIIWSICDEYTWCLPAHMKYSDKIAAENIDLFSAETGFALSEIYKILENRLPDPIKERIVFEIKRRITNAFIKNPFFWWERSENNWAAVCGGSVGSVFILMESEKFPLIEPRIENAIASFLSSYEEDGVCKEGYGYWNYGFGYFVFYAELLYEFSNHAKDLFADSKVKKIAEFQQKVFIQDNVTASFSDGSIKASHYVGLSHFLKSKFNISIPDEKYRNSHIDGTGDTCYRYAAFLRELIWYNPEYKNSEKTHGYYYLKSSEWYINKKENYSFAAKGGDNDEPHNQNDIGCFIIAVNGEQFICDIGAGEYIKAYFMPETRYKLICNSSLGHSVPIICKNEQSAGKEFIGKILKADNKGLEIQFEKAYNEPRLKSLNRKFSFSENEITLRDEFIFNSSESDFIERFISKFEPKISSDSLIIENMEIKFDKSSFDLKITKEYYKNHDADDDILYTIDFIPLNNISYAEFRFVI